VAGTGPLVFARLRPDATIDRASSEVQAIAQGMSAQFPERARPLTPWLITLGEEDIGDITPTVILLAASVALLRR
jgi:hypothetical protein